MQRMEIARIDHIRQQITTAEHISPTVRAIHSYFSISELISLLSVI